MKVVKFASIVLGTGYHAKENVTSFSNKYNDTTFFGVGNMQEACNLAIELVQLGYECIELCGAFDKDGARKIIEVTENKIAVGYSVHLPEQDGLFERIFG